MEAIQTAADGLRREFKIVVAAEDIAIRMDARLEEIRKTTNINGFRPGKVPVSMLRKRYGDALRGEILEQAVSESSSRAISENKLRPATQPAIEVTAFEPGGNLEYSMSVEIIPDIVLGDFSAIKLTRLVGEVGDDDIAEMLDRMTESAKNFVTPAKPRKAKRGDALVIDFTGSLGGVEFDGGSAENHTLELGENAFIEGFEDQLIGAKPGDHVTVNVTFPEAYENGDIAGKDAVFEVDVKEIQEAVPVILDDDFAKTRGFDDLDAMRAIAKERMSLSCAGVTRSHIKRALLDKLAELYDFQLPSGMVASEFEAIWKQLMEDREKNETDPSDVGRDDDDLKEDYRAIAERRVRLGLLLSEIGRVRNITIEPDEINRALVEQARAFPGREEQVVKHYQENRQALDSLRAPLLEDKVVDLIISEAVVTDKKVSMEALVNASEEPSPDSKKTVKKTGEKGAMKKAAAPKKTAAPKKPKKSPALKKSSAENK